MSLVEANHIIQSRSFIMDTIIKANHIIQSRSSIIDTITKANHIIQSAISWAISSNHNRIVTILFNIHYKDLI
jgi:hypothetical protein